MTTDLVVMEGHSWSEACRFESQYHLQDGHFSHIFVVKIVLIFVKNQLKPKVLKQNPNSTVLRSMQDNKPDPMYRASNRLFISTPLFLKPSSELTPRLPPFCNTTHPQPTLHPISIRSSLYLLLVSSMQMVTKHWDLKVSSTTHG